MKVISTYNLKGGVGKTAAAVNLAYIAAQSGLRTLLWDLDAQGAASFYLRVRPGLDGGAAALLEDKRGLGRAIRATDLAGLDLIPADFNYRNLDVELRDFKKGGVRLKRMLREVADDYDLVFVDSAPSMSTVSENILAMSDVLLVPLIPTHLSLRAFEQLLVFRAAQSDCHAEVVPFFSMVDRRKSLHRELIIEFAQAHPSLLRSYVPYSADIERMGEHRAPVNAYADGSPGGRAFRALWAALRERLEYQAMKASDDE